MKNVKTVLGVIISLLLIAWLLYDFVAPFIMDTSVQDCANTDLGCQGDTRWGQ